MPHVSAGGGFAEGLTEGAAVFGDLSIRRKQQAIDQEQERLNLAERMEIRTGEKRSKLMKMRMEDIESGLLDLKNLSNEPESSKALVGELNKLAQQVDTFREAGTPSGLGVMLARIEQARAQPSPEELAVLEGTAAGEGANAELIAQLGQEPTSIQRQRAAGVEPPRAATEPGQAAQDLGLVREQFGDGSPELENFIAAQAAEAEPKVDFKDQNSLRKSFFAQSKDFQMAQTQFFRLQAAASGETPISDIATIFAFLKVLDPPSTVREGEAETVKNATGVADRWKNLAVRVFEGDKLTPQQRIEIMDVAGQAFDEQLADHRITEEFFAKVAKAGGFNPELIIQPMVRPRSVTKPTSTPAAEEEDVSEIATMSPDDVVALIGQDGNSPALRAALAKRLDVIMAQ